jgi:integrase
MSAITIRSVKALAQGETIWDTSVKGFGARRQLNAVSYVLKYRHQGKQRFVTLGRHGALTPDEARKKAKRLLGSVAGGVDPIAPKAETLGAVANEYLQVAAKVLRHNTYRGTKRYLQDCWKAYHSMPIAAMKRRDVAKGLADIEAKYGPFIALRARAALSTMFNWAIRQGYELPANPVQGTNRTILKSRERVLTNPELASIWRQCGDDDFGRIVKLLILTGQRRDEVGRMTWGEIDLDKKLWVIPGTRTKNHREHILPLTDAALALLPERRRDYVFGNGIGFSNWSRAQRRITGVAAWRLHDLRRTAVTMMAELGILPHIIEAIVNHVSGHRAGVAGIYNKAKYLDEMRIALEKWSSHVGELTN